MITPQEFLDEIAPIALATQNSTKLPAQEMIAQAVVESSWGKTPVGRANFFGIKRAPRHLLFCLVTTHEEFNQDQIDHWNATHPVHPARIITALSNGKFDVELADEFADYPSLADSCADFAWLITHGDPYHKAWSQFLGDGNLDALIHGVAVVYATSSAYTNLVTTIAHQHNVLAAITAARAA